jgi:hypothetical protein
MAFSQDDLDALEDAIKSGAEEVQYRDKKIKYRSLEKMLSLRDLMRRELGLTGDATTAIVYPTTAKGFDGSSSGGFDTNEGSEV